MGAVVAVTMVKDEVDIIGETVANMAAQVDLVIVADNGSTDGTVDVLYWLSETLGNILVTHDPDPAYTQSEKMTGLAHLAARTTPTEWVVPFDADEIWYTNTGTVGETLRNVGDLACVQAELFDHVATGYDADDPNPVTRMVWRRLTPLVFPKVACRYRHDLTIHQGNHGCDYGGIIPAAAPLLVVRHFPYRTVEQFIRKTRNGAAAYQAAGDRQPLSAGAHWRQWGQILDEQGEDAVAEVFRTWYWRADPTRPVMIHGERQPRLINDPAPRR